ncbi:MAG: glycosyltransferase [Chloroflexi bacterium]|nr:MAG: glycosyltransferase [Chloroflexota bacterium]
MTVAVVIPSFNRRHWLVQTLPTYRSVRGISEIIIVDDGSQDGTHELVQDSSREDPRIKLVRHTRNKGLPAARNSGADAAESEFVCYGEDEVVFEPDYVETLVRHLEEQRADIIAGPRAPIESYESRGEALQRYVQATSTHIPWHLDYRFALPTDVDVEWPFLSACALIRRNVATRLRYDEGLIGNFYREEGDFYLRALAAGHRLVYCPHTACYHYVVDRSMDRGGCHSRSKFRTGLFSVANNWRYVRRNQQALARYSFPNPVLLQAAFVAENGRKAAFALARRFGLASQRVH